MIGTGRGAQLGSLIKGPQVLESTRRIDTIVLDKTGAITTGHMSMAAVHPGAEESRDEVLRLAGALEDASEHPIARAHRHLRSCRWCAVTAGAGVRQPRRARVTSVIEGHAVLVGRRSWLAEEWSLQAPPALQRAADEAESRGTTPVWVAWDGAVRGVIVVADTIKDTSAAAIAQFRRLGLRPMLLTGDNQRAAQAVAAQVGIDP